MYRVSSIGQVEKDDIPMQRLFCREFVAGHSNWVIVKELYEKGVSGFKKSAKERDAIQELQQDAVEGKFDILLVYMFDRLGRKVIREESRLSIDLLNELVAKAQEEIHRLTLSSEEARSSLEEVQHSAAQEEQEMNQLKTWADLYDNCTFAAKKMIASQFIKSIHVYRDYTLEIMFNVTFDEFRKLSADTRNLGNEKAEIYARAE